MKSLSFQCTICTFYSIFSSQPNEVGHDFTLHNCDIIQHIFFPTRSVARKTLLWTFSWASNSKFAIFLQLYPCNNYRAIKYPPVSIECGMEYPPVSQTLLIQGDNLSPCIIYRAFLNTGGSYCTMCTLCSALMDSWAQWSRIKSIKPGSNVGRDNHRCSRGKIAVFEPTGNPMVVGVLSYL